MKEQWTACSPDQAVQTGVLDRETQARSKFLPNNGVRQVSLITAGKGIMAMGQTLAVQDQLKT